MGSGLRINQDGTRTTAIWNHRPRRHLILGELLNQPSEGIQECDLLAVVAELCPTAIVFSDRDPHPDRVVIDCKCALTSHYHTPLARSKSRPTYVPSWSAGR